MQDIPLLLDSIYRIFLYMQDIPLYTGYSSIYRIFLYIQDIPLYTGYSSIYRIFLYMQDIPLLLDSIWSIFFSSLTLYAGYSSICRIFLYMQDIPLYAGYSSICRIFLSSLTLYNTLLFTWSITMTFSVLLQCHISTPSRHFSPTFRWVQVSTPYKVVLQLYHYTYITQTHYFKDWTASSCIWL